MRVIAAPDRDGSVLDLRAGDGSQGDLGEPAPAVARKPFDESKIIASNRAATAVATLSIAFVVELPIASSKFPTRHTGGPSPPPYHRTWHADRIP